MEHSERGIVPFVETFPDPYETNTGQFYIGIYLEEFKLETYISFFNNEIEENYFFSFFLLIEMENKSLDRSISFSIFLQLEIITISHIL